jgi:hypothetical protein
MTRCYTKPSLRFIKIGLSGIASRHDWPYADSVTKLGYLVGAKNPVSHWALGTEGATGATGYRIGGRSCIWGMYNRL